MDDSDRSSASAPPRVHLEEPVDVTVADTLVRGGAPDAVRVLSNEPYVEHRSTSSGRGSSR